MSSNKFELIYPYISIDNAKKQLIKEFGNMCFLGGSITTKNPVTYHHLFKNIYWDLSKIVPYYNYINGALLSRNEYDIFHLIESIDYKISNGLNDGFKEFKKFKNFVTIIQMREFITDWIIKNGYGIIQKSEIVLLKSKK